MAKLPPELTKAIESHHDSISHVVLSGGDTREPKKWKDALAVVDPIEAALPEGGYLRTNIALAKELRAAVETADSAQRAAKLATLLAKCQKRDPAERYIHYSSIWSACKNGKHTELLREVEKLQAEVR